MPVITLPDGQQKTFDAPVTVFDVAHGLSRQLAKGALAARFQDQLVDTSFLIEEDGALELVLDDDPAALDIIRHSCAHLLGQAVQALYPGAQVTIGPVIDNGFFYDFAYERPFTQDDLSAIEKKMKSLVKQNLPVKRHMMSRDEAVEFFQARGEHYKVEIINSIPSDQALSFYSQGDFIDLCRGPHVPNTSKCKAFKLTKVAGAYWRGDAKNAMLQRIYGTAWVTTQQLDAYLAQLSEAEKRDHRKLGKHLNLFHMQEEAPGMVFWHPKGWMIYQILEQMIRQKLAQQGYQEIRTPQIVSRQLWERSGHWDKFQENMFTLTADEQAYAIKPMNCPGHVQIFNQGLKSYRDLPLRLAEFGSCHRYEPSGALHGLMRVRHFVQDDAHIFCSEADIQQEVAAFIELLFDTYRDFGFENILIKFSDRPEQRVGEDALWDKAEEALLKALNAAQLSFEKNPGEGAFYGPKIEFSLKDSLGRVWQCGTIQVDFSMPGRLGAEFVNESGQRETPVMLHRAILGSLERFIAILLEESGGALPLWLAPEQVAVLNITQNQDKYLQNVAQFLREAGIRVVEDLRNEKIGFKIREHTLQKIPYLLIVGDEEMQNQSVSVRTRSGENLGNQSLNQLLERLNQEIAGRSRRVPSQE